MIFGEEYIEKSAIVQFNSAMSQYYSIKGALMPDAHKGYGLPIGGVVATEGVIVPSWVGYDIGCGCSSFKTPWSANELSRDMRVHIYKKINQQVPVGFERHKNAQDWDNSDIPRTDFLNDIFRNGGSNQLNTLGGGNHFIEVGADEFGMIWVSLHSGSRGVGHKTATKYMKIAGGGKAKEGHFPLMVESQDAKDYITDMKFCLEFALENRKRMIQTVVTIISEVLGEKEYCYDMSNLINRNHNHAELTKKGLWIHRKGATHADKGYLGVIPANMKDGVFIVKGKGNKDSLNSSSHGAGRLLGRKVAKQTLDINEFKNIMVGIVSNADHSTLDESPMAYKDIHVVLGLQKNLIDVLHHIRPLINVKG